MNHRHRTAHQVIGASILPLPAGEGRGEGESREGEAAHLVVAERPRTRRTLRVWLISGCASGTSAAVRTTLPLNAIAEYKIADRRLHSPRS